MEETAPLRQNIGYQAVMFDPTRGTTMNISQEQALLPRGGEKSWTCSM
jgi:hypothetical protein